MSRVALTMFALLLIGSLLAIAENIKLNVPLLLEYGAEIGVYSGAMSCGPCSLEMCAAYLQERPPTFENVKRINAFLDPSRANDDYYLRHGKYTSWDEIVRAARGVYSLEGPMAVPFSFKKILEELKKGAPVIVSIENYGAIPERHDKRYTGGHFLVVCGVSNDKVICQDPDNPKPFVEYSLQNLEKAVGDYYMIVGFEPLKIVRKEIVPGERKAVLTFNFPIEGLDRGSGVELRNGKLEIPLNRSVSTYNVRLRAKGRVANFTIKAPRFLPEEEEKPFVWLKGKYFVSSRAPFAFLVQGYKMERWFVEQKGNHLLMVSRIITVGYDNNLKFEITGVGTTLIEGFIKKPPPGDPYSRSYYMIGLPDGEGVSKVAEERGRGLKIGEVRIYVSIDGTKLLLFEVREGRIVGSPFRFKELTPPRPLPSSVVGEIEKVIKEVFG